MWAIAGRLTPFNFPRFILFFEVSISNVVNRTISTRPIPVHSRKGFASARNTGTCMHVGKYECIWKARRKGNLKGKWNFTIHLAFCPAAEWVKPVWITGSGVSAQRENLASAVFLILPLLFFFFFLSLSLSVPFYLPHFSRFSYCFIQSRLLGLLFGNDFLRSAVVTDSRQWGKRCGSESTVSLAPLFLLAFLGCDCDSNPHTSILCSAIALLFERDRDFELTDWVWDLYILEIRVRVYENPESWSIQMSSMPNALKEKKKKITRSSGHRLLHAGCFFSCLLSFVFGSFTKARGT